MDEGLASMHSNTLPGLFRAIRHSSYPDGSSGVVLHPHKVVFLKVSFNLHYPYR